MDEEEVQKEFEALVRPLIDFLNRKGHPHMRIIIDTTSAQIVEGVRCFHTEDYLRD